jgi:type IV pilus assembly protein PilM
MARRSKVGVGIDIGSRGVQLAILKSSKSKVQLERVDSRDFPADTVVDGTTVDTQLISERIADLIKSNKLTGKLVALSVAGRRVMIKKIETDTMSDDELKSAILYEAKSNLPFDVSEVCLDYSKMSQESDSGRMEVLLVAAKNERIFDAVEPLYWGGGRPTLLEAAPFALQASLTESGYFDEGTSVAALQIGFQATDITIFERGQFESTKNYSVGGKAYVEALIRHMGVPFERATAILAATTHTPDEQAALDIVALQVAEKIADQVERGMPAHFGSMADHPVDKILLCGGGADLPALQFAIQRKFNCQVEVANPFRNLEVNAQGVSAQSSEHSTKYATAIGLALRALGEPHTGFNLLYRSDQPGARTASYAGAGTVLTVIGFASVFLGMGIAYIAQENTLGSLTTELDKVKKEADLYRDKIALVEDLTTKRADVSTRIDVISELDRNRFARIRLMQSLNDALPELTWVTGVDEVSTTRGRGVNISGVTSSNLKVSQFMTNLLGDKNVRGVDLLVSEVGRISDLSVTTFTLQVGYPSLGMANLVPEKKVDLLAQGAKAIKEKRAAEDELMKQKK